MDTGRVEGKAICPTKILIFDLATDHLLHKYVVPDDQVLFGKAALVTPIVDVGKMCSDTYLYVADVDQNGLLIYDFYHDYSWRVNNTRGNAFGPDDDATNITIAGESFNLTDGTLGMSLSPKGYFDERYRSKLETNVSLLIKLISNICKYFFKKKKKKKENQYTTR